MPNATAVASAPLFSPKELQSLARIAILLQELTPTQQERAAELLGDAVEEFDTIGHLGAFIEMLREIATHREMRRYALAEQLKSGRALLRDLAHNATPTTRGEKR